MSRLVNLYAGRVTGAHIGEAVEVSTLVIDQETYPVPVQVTGLLLGVRQWPTAHRTILRILQGTGSTIGDAVEVDLRSDASVTLGTVDQVLGGAA